MTMTTMMMAQRQHLLQHISEHVTKFLAPQDDLGSYRQLVNDNLNSLPDHKPNTRLHTLAIFFAYMIARKKVNHHTAAAAAAAAAAPSPTYLEAQRYLLAATTAAAAIAASAAQSPTYLEAQRYLLAATTAAAATAAAASTPNKADATAASLLSLDTLVETAVKSIDEGEISPILSKYM